MKNITLLIFIFSSIFAIGQNRIPVSSVGSQLLIEDAKSSSLGEVTAATNPNDESSWRFNVGKQAFIDRKIGFSFNYMPNESRLIKGMSLFSFTAFKKVRNNENQVFLFDLRNYSYGKSELRDNDGNYLGESSSNDLSMKLGFSMKLSKNWSTGISLGFLYSNLFGNLNTLGLGLQPATTVNGDIGVFYTSNNRVLRDTLFSRGSYIDFNKEQYWNFGFSIVNIGGKLNYGDWQNRSYAPMQFRLGGLYSLQLNDNNRLNITSDLTKDLIPTPNGNHLDNGSLGIIFSSWGDAPNGFKEEIQEIRLHSGLEISHKEKIALRMGVMAESKFKGNRSNFSVGLALLNAKTPDKNKSLNAAISYSIPLSSSMTGIVNTFRASINLNFGKINFRY